MRGPCCQQRSCGTGSRYADGRGSGAPCRVNPRHRVFHHNAINCRQLQSREAFAIDFRIRFRVHDIIAGQNRPEELPAPIHFQKSLHTAARTRTGKCQQVRFRQAGQDSQTISGYGIDLEHLLPREQRFACRRVPNCFSTDSEVRAPEFRHENFLCSPPGVVCVLKVGYAERTQYFLESSPVALRRMYQYAVQIEHHSANMRPHHLSKKRLSLLYREMPYWTDATRMKVTAFVVFIISSSLAFYVLAGYPLVLAFLARYFGKPILKRDITETVSVIIAVRNGERWLRQKLESVLALHYPPDKLLEIMIVSDGSTDGTEQIARSYSDRGVRLLIVPPGGKPAALNAAVPQAKGDLLLMTDVRQILDADCLKYLVACMARSLRRHSERQSQDQTGNDYRGRGYRPLLAI